MPENAELLTETIGLMVDVAESTARLEELLASLLVDQNHLRNYSPEGQQEEAGKSRILFESARHIREKVSVLRGATKQLL